MEDPNNKKEVYFADWCKTCKYGHLEEYKEPCEECISQPWNENSHKPIKYKEAER